MFENCLISANSFQLTLFSLSQVDLTSSLSHSPTEAFSRKLDNFHLKTQNTDKMMQHIIVSIPVEFHYCLKVLRLTLNQTFQVFRKVSHKFLGPRFRGAKSIRIAGPPVRVRWFDFHGQPYTKHFREKTCYKQKRLRSQERLLHLLSTPKCSIERSFF